MLCHPVCDRGSKKHHISISPLVIFEGAPDAAVPLVKEGDVVDGVVRRSAAVDPGGGQAVQEEVGQVLPVFHPDNHRDHFLGWDQKVS